MVEPPLPPSPPNPAAPIAASTATLRVLDANINRAAEGLRVVEEYARFIANDRQLSQHCKQLRHDFREAVAELTLPVRSRARDTEGDVGTSITTAGELAGATPWDVAIANLQRVKQSLRVLEEYGKLSYAGLSRNCEQLRYRLYTLEKCLSIQEDAGRRLDAARLYVLIDGLAHEGTSPFRNAPSTHSPSANSQRTSDEAPPERESAERESAEREFAERAAALVAVGVHVLQLRDKSLDDRRLLARAQLLREITRGSSTLFIMNDRPDLALLADADGVHVGQEELTVRQVRTIVGPQKLVGVSTHTLQQLEQAVQDGADYVGCGPVFPSQTKAFQLFAGLEFLRQAQTHAMLPAFAIGGISHENLPRLLEIGWRRIAVRDAVWKATDPAAAARRMLEMLRGHESSWPAAPATSAGSAKSHAPGAQGDPTEPERPG